MITVEQLAPAFNGNLQRAGSWLDPLKAAMALHDISTPMRMSAFIAQLAHETAGFTRLVESLNYTPEALQRVFNNRRITRFNDAQAQRYGRTADHPANQRMIANIAYANRMGNGAPETDDGWQYRGRGPIQLTGKYNYEKCSEGISVDLIARPELLAEPDVGCMAAAWFWTMGNGKANLNIIAERGDIDGVSDYINMGRKTQTYGDSHGFNDRRNKWNLMMEALT